MPPTIHCIANIGSRCVGDILVSGQRTEDGLPLYTDESEPAVRTRPRVREPVASDRTAKLGRGPAVETSLSASRFDLPAGFATTA